MYLWSPATGSNGALRFPGRRVETIEDYTYITSTTNGLFATHRAYQIREYLGDGTVFTYRLILPAFLDEAWCWAEMEIRFRESIGVDK
jgi:hypothetical protein